MKPWFGRRAAAGPTPGEAYREGRLDEQRAESADTRTARTTPARPVVVRRGPRLPILSFVLLLIVAFGAVMLYLGAQNGSFARGGAVIDHDLAKATQPVRNAEVRTGAALQRAGQNLQQDAGAPASQ